MMMSSPVMSQHANLQQNLLPYPYTYLRDHTFYQTHFTQADPLILLTTRPSTCNSTQTLRPYNQMLSMTSAVTPTTSGSSCQQQFELDCWCCSLPLQLVSSEIGFARTTEPYGRCARERETYISIQSSPPPHTCTQLACIIISLSPDCLFVV